VTLCTTIPTTPPIKKDRREDSNTAIIKSGLPDCSAEEPVVVVAVDVTVEDEVEVEDIVAVEDEVTVVTMESERQFQICP
jgi:hypothetical protein